MIDTLTMDRLLNLSADERLALAEALWNSLATEPQSVPVPDWHREIVVERLNDGVTQEPGEEWRSVRRRIEGGH